MLRSLILVPALTIGLAVPATAADLPKSGSFDLEVGWKAIGEVTQVADKHIFAAGKVWGVSFNTSGKDPLHLGPALCTYEGEAINGAGTNRGRCAWSDADGDKVFTEWSGKFTAGVGGTGSSTITLGTGKYQGIQGSGPYTCKVLNAANAQSLCKQHFDYQLTAEASGSTTPPAATPSK